MAIETIVTAIVAALSAGMVETGKKAAGDAYDGLKSMIKGRFGAESKAAAAIEELEEDPESLGRRLTLGEELKKVDAGADAELVSAAQAVLAVIKELPQGEKNIQTARGQGSAQASGHGASATVTFSNGPKGDG